MNTPSEYLKRMLICYGTESDAIEALEADPTSENAVLALRRNAKISAIANRILEENMPEDNDYQMEITEIIRLQRMMNDLIRNAPDHCDSASKIREVQEKLRDAWGDLKAVLRGNQVLIEAVMTQEEFNDLNEGVLLGWDEKEWAGYKIMEAILPYWYKGELSIMIQEPHGAEWDKVFAKIGEDSEEEDPVLKTEEADDPFGDLVQKLIDLQGLDDAFNLLAQESWGLDGTKRSVSYPKDGDQEFMQKWGGIIDEIARTRDEIIEILTEEEEYHDIVMTQEDFLKWLSAINLKYYAFRNTLGRRFQADRYACKGGLSILVLD
jgi:hypothetical protein